MPPILCINADFEMAWSGRRKPDDPARDGLFAGTPETAAKILEILDRYEIPVTWATVGALMLTKPFDFGRFAAYGSADPFFDGDWYAPPAFGTPRGEFFYAPKTVERILSAKTKHEIGCHTFTHIYLGEGSVSRERMSLELEACAETAREWDLSLDTFVFPSQYVGYTDLLARFGYKVYRQDALEWFRFGKPYIPSFNVNRRNRLRKAAGGLGKLLDERLALAPRAYRTEEDAAGLLRFTNSTFLPGYRGVSKWVTAGQRVRRLCKGISRAVRENGLFAFFFHPWNFNRRREECLGALEQICGYAAQQRERHGLKIVTARDLLLPENRF